MDEQNSAEHPLDQAAKVVPGGRASLARELNVKPSALGNWKSRGVPAERCPTIERLTSGAVRCETLRPDVEWAYLRGTAPARAEAANA